MEKIGLSFIAQRDIQYIVLLAVVTHRPPVIA